MNEITEIDQLINSDKSRIDIENDLLTIDKLAIKFGELYIVSYSKEPRYIGVHREKCEVYKSWLKVSEIKLKKCNTYNEAVDIAGTLINKVQTDVSLFCSKCQPHWDLSSIKKSILTSILDLNYKVDELDKKISHYKIEISKAEGKILELENSIKSYANSYNKTIQTKNNLIKNLELNEIERISNEFKRCPFSKEILLKSTTDFKPEQKSNMSGKRYEAGGRLYLTESSRTNADAKYFFSNWKDKWVLKIDLYNYYEKGPSDIPAYVLFNSMYFDFDPNQLIYIPNENGEYMKIHTWISYQELKVLV